MSLFLTTPVVPAQCWRANVWWNGSQLSVERRRTSWLRDSVCDWHWLGRFPHRALLRHRPSRVGSVFGRRRSAGIESESASTDCQTLTADLVRRPTPRKTKKWPSAAGASASARTTSAIWCLITPTSFSPPMPTIADSPCSTSTPRTSRRWKSACRSTAAWRRFCNKWKRNRFWTTQPWSLLAITAPFYPSTTQHQSVRSSTSCQQALCRCPIGLSKNIL